MGLSLLGGIGGLLWSGPWIAARCLLFMQRTVGGPWPSLTHPTPWATVLAGALLTWAVAALPVAMGLLLLGVIGGWMLQGFRLGGRWKPQWQHLNPLAGLTQMISRQSIADLGRRTLTVLTLAAAAALAAALEGWRWLALAGVPAAALPAVAARLLWPVWAAATAVFLLWAAVDVLVQARRFQQKLKMTTQELRDEMRESDGDPRWRARRRAVAEQGLKRAARSVRDAAVVITNPTHAAVALAWDPGQDAPPIVAAKGVDDTAAVLRALAADAGIPIIQDPPLAWALMTVPLGESIPPDHWQAVALILAAIMKRRAQRRSLATL